jgi:phosphoribosylformylglycinamidine synthase
MLATVIVREHSKRRPIRDVCGVCDCLRRRCHCPPLVAHLTRTPGSRVWCPPVAIFHFKMIIRLFRTPAASEDRLAARLEALRRAAPELVSLEAELCFYVQVEAADLAEAERKKLRWLLADPEAPDLLTEASVLPPEAGDSIVVEIGPRLNFSTAFSTNAVSICRAVGLPVVRLEVATRYLLRWPKKADRGVEQEV